MKCRCRPDSCRHPTYPRKRSCLKCGRIARPPRPEPEPEATLIHHCARCRADVHTGQPAGMLYLVHVDGAVEESLRFCERCTRVLFESALNYKTPEQVEAEYLHSA